MAASLAAAAVALALPPTPARGVFLAVALLALAIDFARRREPLRTAFRRAFGRWLRPAESDRLTGATTLAIGFAAAILIFPLEMAVVGILYAGLADTAAAAVGRRWGRHPLPGGKSVEGAAAFLAAAALIGIGVPWMGLPAALLTAFVLTSIETLSGRLDDNLLLPPLGAAVAWIVHNIVG